MQEMIALEGWTVTGRQKCVRRRTGLCMLHTNDAEKCAVVFAGRTSSTTKSWSLHIAGKTGRM
jgi:hypothetical protein